MRLDPYVPRESNQRARSGMRCGQADAVGRRPWQVRRGTKKHLRDVVVIAFPPLGTEPIPTQSIWSSRRGDILLFGACFTRRLRQQV
jgi:hypothetical protein